MKGSRGIIKHAQCKLNTALLCACASVVDVKHERAECHPLFTTTEMHTNTKHVSTVQRLIRPPQIKLQPITTTTTKATNINLIPSANTLRSIQNNTHTPHTVSRTAQRPMQPWLCTGVWPTIEHNQGLARMHRDAHRLIMC